MISPKASTYQFSQPFALENGQSLNGLRLHYTTYGTLNANASNVVWICHALTANADPSEWWPGLVGENDLLNPHDHFIICANMLGSCYGSSGPLSINGEKGRPHFHDFPAITNRDVARAFDQLRQHLGIHTIQTLVGGSMGGQQALEWALLQPERIKDLVLLATNAQHSPWGIAFNETQRMAIAQDVTWSLNSPIAGMEGLKAARAIAMLSYRHYKTYQASQQEESNEVADGFRASSYQQYQGQKLADRFNAFSYWTLSKAMDSHNVARNRGQIEEVLQAVKARTLVIGLSSDVLFPLAEQEFLAMHIPKAKLEVIDSLYGHDGFLMETKKITALLQEFLNIPTPSQTVYA